jgi:hypothetical protein
MKKIDLHTHSYYSDGQNSPAELLEFAYKKKLKIFSLTDHNFISKEQKNLQKEALNKNILFIEGIEVSCVDRESNKSLHILGYSHSFNIGKINKALTPVIYGYNERAKKIIDKLNNKFKIGLNFDELKKEIPSVYISRNHIAKKLSDFLDNKLMFKEILKEVFVEEDDSWMPDAKEAIDIISQSGGEAVLAHPGNLIKGDDFENLLKKLINYGLKGIEVYYPKHNPESIKKLEEIALKYKLIITAGSDWHGQIFSKTEMGLNVADKVYNDIVSI